MNALLSFAYAMLAKDCFSALCIVGFDPYRGFFHAGRHGRPSLALDLMEEFRAVIADSVVLTLINNRVVGPEDFVTWREACQLTEEGRKKFFAAYEQRLRHRRHSSRLRVQDVLFADAGGPGPDAGRVRARRYPPLHGLHGALRESRRGHLHRGVRYLPSQTAAEGGDGVRGLRDAQAVLGVPLPPERHGFREAAEPAS